MLDGLCKLPELIEAVKKHGQKAIGLTDHGVMYGSLHFYNHCLKAGIKPIVGVEAYVAEHSRLEKQVRMGSDQAHLTLLALNQAGYKNLLKLVSLAHLEGFSYKPRIDEELLAKYAGDLVLLTGCAQSPLNKLLQAGRLEEARAKLDFYRQIMPGRVYIELQRHPNLPQLEELVPLQVQLARELNLPLVATNDVHYIAAEDAYAQDALICVSTRKLLADKNRLSMMESPDLYLRSSEEMATLFHDFPEAIANTVVIAEQVDLKIPTGQLIFPRYDLPSGATANSFLRQLTFERAAERLGELTTEFKDRLDYELKIITQKGYATYFLITQDFVNWAKREGIGVGPGRGSAAGSLVSYCLGITSINPIEHGLAFERFLNPERPTPPDIDLDFADDRRDEVIDYVAEKYGADRVAHVITFGRMEARVAVRDIGRVMGLPYEEPDRIAKLIPNQAANRLSLQKAVETIPELASYYSQPKFRELINLARKVEGNVRHSSVHAAAIIITDKPMSEYTPIQRDSRSGKIITQYDMYALDCNIADDAIGLLKFDFLGLRNLTIMQVALGLIKRYRHLEIELDSLPLDDEATFKLLASGNTMGVFQLESGGMRRVARSLRPSQFSDIAALVALYRPGPMELIPQFIEGKHKPDSITYPHENLIPILQETYGVMVYQEQILEIAHLMAGYSLGEADILRRAIGKKKKSLLDENQKRFIDRSVSKGYTQATASKIWGFIEAFANYGFNKAHAASYAMIAYQTAYLKANYPIEYMTALMSVEAGSTSANRDERIGQAIEEAKEMGVLVLPPDINHSEESFSIESHPQSRDGLAIRFGLNGIKHIGTVAQKNILEVRAEVGQFDSFTQFLQLTDARRVNKMSLECLIKVGAFDQFGTRASLLENLDEIRKRASGLIPMREGQDSLFAESTHQALKAQDTFTQLTEYPQAELLSFEKELLGVYLTEHPLARSLKLIERETNQKLAQIDASLHLNHRFRVGGMITKLRLVRSKSTGKEMAFGQLQDQSGEREFVVFPRTYQQFAPYLRLDAVVIMSIKVDVREGEVQLIAESIQAPHLSAPFGGAEGDQASPQKREAIFIKRGTDQATLQALGKLLKAQPGEQAIDILIENGPEPERTTLPYGVAWSRELAEQVRALLGEAS